MARQAQTEPTLQAHSWQYYLHSKDAWEAMYNDCANAKTSIAYEQYILSNDVIGRHFMELFIRKAKEGVRVLLVCDHFGSRTFYDSAIVEEFRSAGGEFYFYHPIGFLTKLVPWLCFPRTHTKTLLVDSEIAYGGGVCVADYMLKWRDTQIRVTGPVIAQIDKAFEDLAAQFIRPPEKRKPVPQPPADISFRYLLNRPRRRNHAVYREIMNAIGYAEDYIYITSAFFIPGYRFFKHIRNAHKRGVEVRVLIPLKSDVPLADLICMSYFTRMLKDGIRIFYYKPTVLHTKSAVIDGKWATIGSTNFDLISFFHNREANIVINDKKAIAQLEQHFFNDLKESIEVTEEFVKHIPLWKKLVGRAARILKIGF